MSVHLRQKELINLGLTDKESRVYLASLELGEAPVQDVARKAGVNRATTYVMIEQLTSKGLMSSIERGKKRLFVAESPDKLSTRVRLQITELEEKLGGFKRILPDLHALYDTSGERPRVRFFEGEEGVLGLIEEQHEFLESGIEVRQLVNQDDYIRVFGKHDAHSKQRERSTELDIHYRVLFTSAHPIESTAKSHHRHVVDARRLPSEKFPFHGELVVIKNRTHLIAYHGKVFGVIIESEQIAGFTSCLFDLAWETAEKIHLPGGFIKPLEMQKR